MRTLLFSELSYNASLMVMNMILLWSSGLYYIFSELQKKKYGIRDIIIGGVLSAIFLVLISLLSYIAHRNGYSNMVAVISLLLAMVMLGINLVKTSFARKQNTVPIICLFFWLLAMLYVTMVNRIGEEAGPNVNVNPILALKEIANDGSGFLFHHAIMNIVMFVPLGGLLRLLDGKGKICLKWFCVGAIVSSSVEMVQLMFSLGQCDIIDIMANTLGCVLGILIAHTALFLLDVILNFSRKEKEESET